MMRAVIAMLLLATPLFLSGCGGGDGGDVIAGNADNNESSQIDDTPSPPADDSQGDSSSDDDTGDNADDSTTDDSDSSDDPSSDDQSNDDTSDSVDLMSSQLQLDISGDSASWSDVGAAEYRVLFWSDDAAPMAQTTRNLNYTIPDGILASGGYVLVEANDELGNGIFSNTQTVEAQ